MGELTLLGRFRMWLGEKGFSLHLWALRMTEGQFIDSVYENEVQARKQAQVLDAYVTAKTGKP